MSEGLYGWDFPPDISTHGYAIDRLIDFLHVFMVILFVGWGIYFIYCLIKFRQSARPRANYESVKTKLPKFIEVGVVLFEVFLLVGLSFPVWSKLKHDFPDEKDATVVRIAAQQFVWNIHYPGRDNVFGRTLPSLVAPDNPMGLDPEDRAGRDDIVTVNQFHFPVNKPVIVHLSSFDVIHSFFIPVLRIKQDAVPGMTIPVWFEATQTGQFEIACAQLCGNGHTRMRGFVSVDTAADYETWMKEQESYLVPEEAAAETEEAAPTEEMEGTP